MPVKIIADEVSNLDKESAKKYGIGIIPYMITDAAGKGIRVATDPNIYNPQEDRSNIKNFSTLDEYYGFLGTIRNKSEAPGTGAPDIERCRGFLEDTLREKKGDICCILLASNLSKAYENVKIAAQEVSKRSDRRIGVVDSKQAFDTLGLLAIEAAKLSNQGKGLDEIVEYVEDVKGKVFLIAALDNLEYLRRCGRVPVQKSLLTRIADFLGIIPIISLEGGIPRPICSVRRSGVKKRMLQEIKRRIGYGESIRVVMGYSVERQKKAVLELGELIKSQCNVEEVSYGQANKIVATHTGPNLYGAAIFRQGYSSINGSHLFEMFKASECKLREYRKIIDNINIFPVNDSDTGKNMLKPMTAVTAGLTDRDSILKVIDRISRKASERGGGCSGNALSQYLFGVRSYLGGNLSGNQDLDPAILVNAMEHGAQSAYSSFSEPKEGTILSVMRVVGQRAKEALKDRRDVSYILEKGYCAGVSELLNPRIQEVKVLRDSDVADAGGLGFLIFLGAWLDALGISLRKEVQELNRSLEKEIKSQIASLKYKARYPGFCVECSIKGDVKREDIADRLNFLPNKLEYNALMIGRVNGDTHVHIHVSDRDLVDKAFHICKSYGYEVEERPPTSLSRKKIDVFRYEALRLLKRAKGVPFLFMYWFTPLPRIFFIRGEIKKLRRYRDVSKERDDFELISKALGKKTDEAKKAIFVCNRKGDATYLNRTAREVFNPDKMAEGQKISSYLPKEISKIVEEKLITGAREPFSFKEGGYILRLTPIYEKRKNLGTLLEVKEE